MRLLPPAALVALTASLASAVPLAELLRTRQVVQFPETVYGVDPRLPFNLWAVVAGGASSALQPFYYDFAAGVLGLQAVGGVVAPATPPANFTLVANHYGTQLYAYAAAPCGSSAFCDATRLLWSNDSPVAGRALTFHPGRDAPNFGGLAFYGAYHGGDFAAGESNFLVGAADTQLDGAFALCPWAPNPVVRVLTYRGSGGGRGGNSTCVPVTVSATQVRNN